MKIDKYHLMTFTAFVLSLFSAIMTALGMSDLFQKGGTIIFLIFVCIDLGRFLLFNFLTDEWKNLRKIKYVIVVILALLFGYSAVGIFSQLSGMISPETHKAMLNAAAVNKAAANANVKESRATDLATVARQEYKEAISWNKTDYENCLKRAKTKETQDEIDIAENKCNNTKRWLDNKASKALKDALAKADDSLNKAEESIKDVSKNQGDLASILTTICEIGRMDCGSYQGLHNALSIIIALVIVGTDYLQIAIVLSVNTRKNKKEIEDNGNDDDPDDNGPKGKKKLSEVEEKPEGSTGVELSEKASKKLAKKVNKKSKPKPNKALKDAMKEYDNLLTATTEQVKVEQKEEKALVKKPKKAPKNKVEKKSEEIKNIKEEINSGIEMSEAQEKAVKEIKAKIEENKKQISGLEAAFDVAKADIKKDSKIKHRRRKAFSAETSFM